MKLVKLDEFLMIIFAKYVWFGAKITSAVFFVRGSSQVYCLLFTGRERSA